MDIFFDLNSKQLWFGAIGQTDLQQVKIRQYEDLRLKFLRGGTAELLEVSASISLRLKRTKEAAITLTSTSTFTRPATASDFYTGTLSLNTTQIVTDIFDVDDAPDEITVLAELEWAPAADASLVRKSDDASLQLVRSVATGTESAATDASASTALRSLVGITALTGGTSVCLDAIATVGVTAGQYVFFDITDEPQIWKLKAGTDSAVTGEKVRPTDYHATTNAKFWYRIS